MSNVLKTVIKCRPGLLIPEVEDLHDAFLKELEIEECANAEDNNILTAVA